MAKENKNGKDEQIANMLLDDFDKFEHFAMNYWKQVAAVCALIVVIVAIVATFYAINGASERKANTAIATAKTEAELQKVIKEYPKQQAIWSAYLKLGTIYVGNKDYPKALANYRELLQKGIPDEMRRELEMNIAYLLELQGTKKDAVAAFAKIGSDSFYPEATQCEANFCAGRISNDLGDKTQAKTYLNLTANRVVKGGAFDPAAEFWKKQAQLMILKIDAPAKPATAAPAAAAQTKPVKTATPVKK